MGDFTFVPTPSSSSAALFARWGETTRPRSNTMPPASASKQRRAVYSSRAQRGILFSPPLKWHNLGALTATIGLLTAYLLTRQRFAGQRASNSPRAELRNPGTVVGISLSLPSTCHPSRSPAQFHPDHMFCLPQYAGGCTFRHRHHEPDRQSLDEASLTLGARSFATLRRVVLPLLRPAIVASLVYSFVRAMTAVSAVIFLVSASTTWRRLILWAGSSRASSDRNCVFVSANLVMLLAIILIQILVGERRLGRALSRRPRSQLCGRQDRS